MRPKVRAIRAGAHAQEQAPPATAAQEDGRAGQRQEVQVGDRVLGRGLRDDRRHAQDRAMQEGHRLFQGRQGQIAG